MTDSLPKVPVEPTQKTTIKPKKSGLTIKIVVGLLILVILSEVGYLVYNQYIVPSSKDSLSGPNLDQSPTQALQEAGENLENPDSDPSTSPTPQTSKPNNINQEKLESLTLGLQVDGREFYSASLSYSFRGVISRIDKNHGSSEEGQESFLVGIQNNEEPIGFTLNKNQIITSTVIDRNDPDNKLSLLDLRPGQLIIMTKNFDLITGKESSVIIEVIDY